MRLIIATAPEPAAPAIARELVACKLAACVNIAPKVRSIYAWEGKIEDDTEALLLIKTTAEAEPRLSARLRELHPYDVPEIISIGINAGEGNPAYLQWLQNSVAP